MTVEVPWNAWFEDGEMALSFPDAWQVDVLRMRAPPAPPATVAERIATPLASEPLRTLARGKRLVGIAVDDIARPTPVHEFLPQVVDELLAAGVPEDGIQVFVASGAHRTPVLGDVVRKIGAPLAERLKIVYHNPYDNLADLGHTSNGVPIAINRSYLACDLRISIGGITPHDFAGFGGGYKTVTVGLSGIRALHETHIKRIAEFDAGVARIDGNRFQEYVQEIGAKVGIDFAINVVMTARRGIADLYAGDPDAVFRSACASARERYATPAGRLRRGGPERLPQGHRLGAVDDGLERRLLRQRDAGGGRRHGGGDHARDRRRGTSLPGRRRHGGLRAGGRGGHAGPAADRLLARPEPARRAHLLPGGRRPSCELE